MVFEIALVLAAGGAIGLSTAQLTATGVLFTLNYVASSVVAGGGETYWFTVFATHSVSPYPASMQRRCHAGAQGLSRAR